MISLRIKTLINEYTEILQNALNRTNEYVITGGNMTLSKEGVLKSEIYPTTFTENYCKTFISQHQGDELIQYEIIEYSVWLKNRIKKLKWII